MTVRLVLASGSPARLATLRAAGVDPDVVVPAVDEQPLSGEGAVDLCARLAAAKATAVCATAPGDVLVVGCDSVLELDGEVHGKPRSPTEATGRWHRMRGRSGFLHTGHCLYDVRHSRALTRVASTLVHFGWVSDAEIGAYVSTGEPMRVAGGFTLDGLGGPFVTGIEGDPHNVVGISLPLLREMLAEFGVSWVDLWSR